MPPKPLIGLTTSRIPNTFRNPASAVNEPYHQAITSAGGIPVLIPHALPEEDLAILLPHLDGILFTGGDDIDPRRYGSAPHPKVMGIDTDRDSNEIYLVREALKLGKPFLGICRGLQLINVALGGSLYEDLEEQLAGTIQHENHKLSRDYLAHTVQVEAGSLLRQIQGKEEVRVNSLHHQGIRRLAGELQSCAAAPDGLIEAIVLPGYSFGLAVQWHPEELQAHEDMRCMFQSFVHSCQAVKA